MRRVLIIAVIGTALLLTSCVSMIGVEQRTTGDWDWTLEFAYQVLEDSGYGTDYYVSDFYVENLDREGFFDPEMLFPVWTIYFENGGLEYLRMRIHPDGDFFLEERSYDNRPEGPLDSAYTSREIRSWITTASYIYHQLFGKFDDISYGVSCYTMLYQDMAFVYLKNDDYERLCTVTLDAKAGTVLDIGMP
ncbi:hypothetical protein K8R78_06540 [bacterium]|nr:hypothetical protein [bacterium]